MRKHLSLETVQSLDIIEPGLAFQMMNVFLSEFPQHVQHIQRLIAAENSVEFGRRIHALKGSISVFGCADICHSLKQIELLAKHVKFKEAVAKYEKDKMYIDEFVSEIQIYMTAEANKSAA